MIDAYLPEQMSEEDVAKIVDEVIEQRQRVIAAEKGFKMTEHSLYIYGVCKGCQAEKKVL